MCWDAARVVACAVAVEWRALVGGWCRDSSMIAMPVEEPVPVHVMTGWGVCMLNSAACGVRSDGMTAMEAQVSMRAVIEGQLGKGGWRERLGCPSGEVVM